jgi:hypothetical protein
MQYGVSTAVNTINRDNLFLKMDWDIMTTRYKLYWLITR